MCDRVRSSASALPAACGGRRASKLNDAFVHFGVAFKRDRVDDVRTSTCELFISSRQGDSYPYDHNLTVLANL